MIGIGSELEDRKSLCELSFDKEKLAIILRVHKDAVKHLNDSGRTPVLSNARMVKTLKEKFDFELFSGSFEMDFFGFEKAFKRIGEKGDFIEFLIKIPEVKSRTETKECIICKGSKKGFDGEKCLFCEGKGKRYVFDFKMAYAVSGSFNIFFKLMELCRNNKPYSFFQLIEIGVSTETGLHGGSVWGKFSPQLVEYLKLFGLHNDINPVVQAMKIVHGYMVGRNSLGDYSFKARAWNSEGLVHIDCPGNACGLDPDSFSGLEDGKGYKFGVHNSDSPVQQITLLVALATLWDMWNKQQKDNKKENEN